MLPGQEYRIEKSKSELCQDIQTSISAYKDVIRNFGVYINQTANNRMQISLLHTQGFRNSIDWNIRDMRKKIKLIKEL